MLPDKIVNKIQNRLRFIYKEKHKEEITNNLIKLISRYYVPGQKQKEKWSEANTVLITYGDSLINREQAPLEALNDFLIQELKKEITHVHVLPFFPFSSDDGFSVIDYKQVNPGLGTWENIREINQHFNLMADLVINHISSKSEWFQNFLDEKNPGKDYFITIDPATDLSSVTRPRSSPLLTPFSTASGMKHVWTTFSADQVDLNFSNPRVLIEMIDILLFYVNQGATIIRLDAIAFLWKETGTSCLHLPETHEVVKLMRDIVELVNPSTIILTETNVPNKENMSYFGDNDEAHMVYQFSLPPLLLHGLHTGNSTFLTKWAKTLPDLPAGNTFFNFTASHDGIGVRPLEGLIHADEFDELLANMKKAGGMISMKKNSDGSESPYEINITYYDALAFTKNGDSRFQKERFISSQTIMLALKGIPAFYIHSLFATPNYLEGVVQTGRARTINRRKYNINELNSILDAKTPNQEIFDELRRRIRIKQKNTCFHPDNPQVIIDLGKNIFAFKRKDEKRQKETFCISNVTAGNITTQLPGFAGITTDILSGQRATNENIQLKPYQTAWLVNDFLTNTT